MTLHQFLQQSTELPQGGRMPLLFIGHGSPMNGIVDTAFSDAWAALGKRLPKPTAVLCVSAHWLTEGSFVHGSAKPKTIHDFWGFPKELYDITYPCPGAPDAARETQSTAQATKIGWDELWGVDHGCWIVMRRMYPNADIPTFQLSMDLAKSCRGHYDIGRELRALRERGVLIIGSGNITHNLGAIDFDENAVPFDWAAKHDADVKRLLESRDHGPLIEYETMGPAALMSHPTPDHWWPLLYVLGASHEDETVSFPVEGITNGSISMRSVLFGG